MNAYSDKLVIYVHMRCLNINTKITIFLTKLDRNIFLRMLYNPTFLGVNPVFSTVTLTPY